MQNKEWHVFNECGTHGYICLLSLPGHFDVLDGINGAPPVIPSSAHTHGISRNNVQSEAWQCLQSDYSFQFVHKFPQQFGGISILNNPVVLYETTADNVVASCEKPGAEQKVTSHICDYPGCNYVAKKVKCLAMHKRCHKKNTQPLTCEYADTKTTLLYFCDFPGCSYSNISKR